eukprot:21877_1
MARCRYGKSCRYGRGRCRFYHSPSPSRSRSRSRDRNNSNNKQNNKRINLKLRAPNHCNERDISSIAKSIQFMTHGESDKWGKIVMKQTEEGVQMTSCSHYPTRIGRCSLTEGKYYYEVIVHTVECNARVGWGLHTQHIDDIDNKRTGKDKKGWSYNGWDADKFCNGGQFDYGSKWNTNHINDVVSCAIDVDKKMIKYYLNGIDLGIAFLGFNLLGEGIAPCISISDKHRVTVITEPNKFRYEMPNEYKGIETTFKMTWSMITDRVTVQMGDRIGRMLREMVNSNIDKHQIEHVLEQLPLKTSEKDQLTTFVETQYEFIPVIHVDAQRGLNAQEVRTLLENRGFKSVHIDHVLTRNLEICADFIYTHSVINTMISECVECESKEAEDTHLRNWKQWRCVEVVEYVNQIANGHFANQKYDTFKKYLKLMNISGKELAHLYDTTLKLLCLNEASDRNLIVTHVDTLTQRRQGKYDIEPPKEYQDPITYELMTDPVICIKSGYTYDRKSIVNQIRTNGADPFTRQKITVSDIVPNRLIKDCIDKWKKENNLII